MVKYMLMITAELENITDLQPQGGCNDPNFTYFFKVRCENCGELSEKETGVILSETVPLRKGAVANLVQKCKFCSREGHITMIEGKGRPLTIESSEYGHYTPVMQFECRGSLQPEEFSFETGWKAVSTAGKVFENIDLSAGEFADYCPKGKFGVMISNLKSKFVMV